MNILITGSTGLVGSRILELLKDSYAFESLGRETGIDITDKNTLKQKISSSSAKFLIHLAAKTDVDGCEKDKEIDSKNIETKDFSSSLSAKTAWAINVLGTQNIIDVCKENNKKLIYISTDFVFDGTHTENNPYLEEDTPNPVNWYAQTKYEGEKLVQAAGIPYMILRMAYPYRANFERNDFVRTIIDRFAGNQEIKAVTDHVMTPSFIDDIALAFDQLIKQDASGIYHLVGSQFITPFEAANLIAEVFGLDKSLISKTTRAEYFENRAPRPFFLGLKNAKIKQLGIDMLSFDQGLGKIKEQRNKLNL